MGKSTGFLEHQRVLAPERAVCERIKDFDEFHTVQDVQTVQEQASRCMDCGIPFCNAGMWVSGTSIGCPLSNLVPETNELVYKGRFAAAYQRLRKTHPFPEFTGRVCPALCEGSCTLGEHEQPVTIKNIEHFLDEYAAENGLLKPRLPLRRTGKRVAVVGSGPSGLAAADRLNQLGIAVTVYERANRVGGLLTYGIPNMKLDKSVVARRQRLLEDEGVRFETGVEVGTALPVEQLLDEYDALVLAGGATKPRLLAAPGSELKGVVPAVQFLTNATKRVLDASFAGEEYLDAKGKQVIVVGGGDTGNDCVGTAIRQGAASIAQFEIVAKPVEERAADNPWPLWPRVFKTDYGQDEAALVFGRDPREFETSIAEVYGNDEGSVRAVKVMRYKNFKPLEGTEQERPADLILIAMGFLGPEPLLPAALGLTTDARSNVATPAGGYATSLPGVFACGDLRRGQSLVVWALMEGIQAAQEVHAWLS